MATANSGLRITELDFDGIKQNLKEFISERSAFTDFDFEGSNWNAILDVLAYNTHYMGYYVNMIANEMFLDSAQLRDSVLSHAKLMNYVPTSKRAPTAYVNIRVTPEDPEDTDAQTLTLNRWTRLISNSLDGKSFMFAVNEARDVAKANGSFLFSNVQIKQGDIVTTQTINERNNNPSRRFNIPSANVDTSTLAIMVQRSRLNTTTEVYTLANDVTVLTANSPVYFLEENPESNGSYSITFGDNYLGKRPPNSSIVIMTYLDTLGPVANKVKSFSLVDTIGGYSANVEITTVSPAAAGTQKESIENIKFRAPLAYTAQNRAVTKKDYESLLLNDYQNIQAISVWGGQDNDPPVYGKVFISMLPRDGYYITTEEKERIVEEIIANRCVMTVTPEIVDPEMLYLILKVTVRYNPNLTTYSQAALKSLVRAQIIEYKERELVDFSDVFRSSALLNEIDNVEESILSTEMEVYVQKRIEVTANTTQNYTVDFGVPLKPGGIFDRISTYPYAIVKDVNDVSREIKIEELANTLTGITSITVTGGGNGYKTNPTVAISGDGVGATASATIVNGRVATITVTNPGTGYTQASVRINGGGGSGATATAYLQADRATLFSYYFGTSGQKMIVSENVGYVRYDLGQVYLSSFTPVTLVENSFYSQDVLTITATPASTIISSSRNQIVTIDENDSTAIQITMIPET